jgi:hypothetical protein
VVGGTDEDWTQNRAVFSQKVEDRAREFDIGRKGIVTDLQASDYEPVVGSFQRGNELSISIQIEGFPN